VLDASWSPCGLRLTACSWDGTAVFIEFTQQELGQPLDPAEQVIIHITYAAFIIFKHFIGEWVIYFFAFVEQPS